MQGAKCVSESFIAKIEFPWVSTIVLLVLITTRSFNHWTTWSVISIRYILLQRSPVVSLFPAFWKKMSAQQLFTLLTRCNCSCKDFFQLMFVVTWFLCNPSDSSNWLLQSLEANLAKTNCFNNLRMSMQEVPMLSASRRVLTCSAFHHAIDRFISN